MKTIDLVGKKFGRLLVKEQAGRNIHKQPMWRCICDCGELKIVAGFRLRYGKTSSCGCYRRELTKHKALVHGDHGTPEHRVWEAIKRRCLNKNSTQFKHYGGRGITVCSRWMKSYENFLADMGRKPSPKHSIDRINNNELYSPENCRWVTHTEQMNNTRSNRLLTFRGKTQNLTQWAKEIGIGGSTLHHRIVRAKWPIEMALTTPCKAWKGYKPC